MKDGIVIVTDLNGIKFSDTPVVDSGDWVSVPRESLLALLDTIGARFDSHQSWAGIAQNLRDDRETLMEQNADLEKRLNEVVERHTRMGQMSRDLRG